LENNKFDFKEGAKKDQSQLILTFETRDHGHKVKTNRIEANPKNNYAKFSTKKKLSDETKKLINKKIESNWINPLALQP